MKLHQGHSELRTEKKKLHNSFRSSAGNWIMTGSSAVTLNHFPPSNSEADDGEK